MKILLKFLECGETFTTLVKEGLPSDCKFCYAIPTYCYGIFDFVIEHESFPELVSGAEIPVLPIIFKRIES